MIEITAHAGQRMLRYGVFEHSVRLANEAADQVLDSYRERKIFQKIMNKHICALLSKTIKV